MLIEQKIDGPWRVSFEFAAPQAAIDLGPTIDGFRAEHWRIDGTAARLIEKDGRDIVEPTGRRTRLSSVAFDVDPEAVSVRKRYEPFMPMGDGGVVFFTGYFMPFGEEGGRLDAALTVIPANGSMVSAFGETATRLENWKSAYDHPAFLYVGATAPIESGAALLIVDGAAPEWIRDEITSFVPAIAKALTQTFMRTLPARPIIFVATADLGDQGRLSYSGDALPGQYQMTLAGGAWRQSSPHALGVLRQSTAHEAAHLWQAAARPRSDAVANWIHEGGADALAAAALVGAGYWTPEEASAAFAEARSTCARSLEQLSLQRAEAEARWDAVYACGHVLNVAAAGEAGVASFWREFIKRGAKDGYDEALFLDLAEERAGPDAVQAIRDLTRINDARPDRVLDRLLALSGGLDVDRGR